VCLNSGSGRLDLAVSDVQWVFYFDFIESGIEALMFSSTIGGLVIFFLYLFSSQKAILILPNH
jgi:hypothetical protein